jgi:hypothetical protein
VTLPVVQDALRVKLTRMNGQCDALRAQVSAAALTKQNALLRAGTAESKSAELDAALRSQQEAAAEAASAAERARKEEVERLDHEREALLGSITKHFEQEMGRVEREREKMTKQLQQLQQLLQQRDSSSSSSSSSNNNSKGASASPASTTTALRRTNSAQRRVNAAAAAAASSSAAAVAATAHDGDQAVGGAAGPTGISGPKTPLQLLEEQSLSAADAVHRAFNEAVGLAADAPDGAAGFQRGAAFSGPGSGVHKQQLSSVQRHFSFARFVPEPSWDAAAAVEGLSWADHADVFSLRVPKVAMHEKEGALYTVCCMCGDASADVRFWATVKRRFSDFEHVHRVCRIFDPSLRLQLPPRTFFLSPSAAQCEERRPQLQTFLEQLLSQCRFAEVGAGPGPFAGGEGGRNWREFAEVRRFLGLPKSANPEPPDDGDDGDGYDDDSDGGAGGGSFAGSESDSSDDQS